MEEYVKYTYLNRKVNWQLDKFIIVLINKPNIWHFFRRITLIWYYNDINILNESKKYSLRNRDKQKISRSQKIKWLVKHYKEDQLSNLEVFDACLIEFAFQSQDISIKWYIVSLSCK